MFCEIKQSFKLIFLKKKKETAHIGNSYQKRKKPFICCHMNGQVHVPNKTRLATWHKLTDIDDTIVAELVG